LTRQANKPQGNHRRLATQQSVNGAVKSICDIMRRSNCAGALQYVPELTWILFLRILDEREAREAEAAEAVAADFAPFLEAPFCWRDWAAPDGLKRKELQDGALGAFFGFVNGEPLPHLKGLREKPGATPRQKVISEIMSGVERTRVDTERNFLDILDKVHEISADRVDPTHVFTLSQIYEGLLLKMGEKGNDDGQFFIPRDHPGYGAGDRAEDRGDGVRPGLRHRRVPGAGLRAHGRSRRQPGGVARPARDAQAPDVLRA
jgi:type I restriction enzyme M protein